MVTIGIQQLHDETERFVREARDQDVHIQDNGTLLAVLSGPRLGASFQEYWSEREKVLAAVTLQGTWNSTEAISDDRERR
jgi:hypothetical protein